MTYTVFSLSKVNRIEYQDNVTVISLDCVSAAVLCEGGKVSSLCKFFLQDFLRTDSTISDLSV